MGSEGEAASTPKRATLADVARLSGVSTATASQVLSGGKGSIRYSVETAERVRWVARSLYYRPALARRYLRQKQTKTLGITLPGVSATGDFEPYSSCLLPAAIHAAVEAGYELIVTIAKLKPQEFSQRITHLLDRDVDGLILIPPKGFEQTDVYRELIETQRAVVTVEHPLAADAFDFVGMDDMADYRQAVEYLKQLGHRHIGFLYEPESDIPSAHQRRVEFEQAIDEAGLPVSPRCYQQIAGSDDVEGARQTWRELQHPVTAVVVRGHMRTQWVCDHLKAVGVRVPQDVSVINITAHDYSEMRMQYDSIRTPVGEIGRRAVELLINRIQQHPLPPRQVLLPGHRVAGATCAALNPQAGCAQ